PRIKGRMRRVRQQRGALLFCTLHLRSDDYMWSEVRGKLPKRPKGSDCKSDCSAFGGSNPSLATFSTRRPRPRTGPSSFPERAARRIRPTNKARIVRLPGLVILWVLRKVAYSDTLDAVEDDRRMTMLIEERTYVLHTG